MLKTVTYFTVMLATCIALLFNIIEQAILDLADYFYKISSVRRRISKYKSVLQNYFKSYSSGFSGLEVACWPLVPKFTGSNLSEAFAFFWAKKSSARLPLEGK